MLGRLRRRSRALWPGGLLALALLGVGPPAWSAPEEAQPLEEMPPPEQMPPSEAMPPPPAPPPPHVSVSRMAAYEPLRAGHPLRIIAYALHPIGVILDYAIFRPAYWIGSHEPIRTLVGQDD